MLCFDDSGDCHWSCSLGQKASVPVEEDINDLKDRRMASSTGSTQSWEISWDKNGTCPGMESMFSSGCRLMFGVPWDEHKLPIPCNLTMALGAVF